MISESGPCTHPLPWRFLSTSHLREIDLARYHVLVLETGVGPGIIIGNSSAEADNTLWDWVHSQTEMLIDICGDAFYEWGSASQFEDRSMDEIDEDEHVGANLNRLACRAFRSAVNERSLTGLSWLVSKLAEDFSGLFHIPDPDFRAIEVVGSGTFYQTLLQYSREQAQSSWTRDAPEPHWLPYSVPDSSFLMSGWPGLLVWLSAEALIGDQMDPAVLNAGVFNCIDSINSSLTEICFPRVDDMLEIGQTSVDMIPGC